MSTAGTNSADGMTRRARLWRGIVSIAVVVQVATFVYLVIHIGRHPNPMGDGMEWVAVMPGLGALAVGVLPAIALGVRTRLLPLAALWALAGVALNIALFLEVASEMRH